MTAMNCKWPEETGAESKVLKIKYTYMVKYNIFQIVHVHDKKNVRCFSIIRHLLAMEQNDDCDELQMTGKDRSRIQNYQD